MRFREVGLIALWTLLIGPVLAHPMIDRSEPKGQVVVPTTRVATTLHARR